VFYPHANFPGWAVAYAASICRALNYDLSLYTIPSDSVQTLQSTVTLQRDLVELAAAGGRRLLRRLGCGGCGGCCCHFGCCRFFVPFRCVSCNEARSWGELSWSILKPLAVPGTCRRNKGKSVSKLKTIGKT
jgi:hypothetical protein